MRLLALPFLASLLLLLTPSAAAQERQTAGLAAASAAPVLIRPADKATLESFGPQLTWSNPSGTTQYHLQIIPANNDGPGVDIHAGSPGTGFQVPPPPRWYGLLPDMTYTWRVRVSGSTAFVGLDDPSWSPWAERTFRTPAVGSDTISAVAPLQGATGAPATPTLQWSNTRTDVFYYEVQLSKDATFNVDPATATAAVYTALIHGGVSNPPNSYTVPASAPLEPGVTYYWRVRPRVQGDGRPLPWGKVTVFTTRGVPFVFAPDGPSRAVIAQYYAWYDPESFTPADMADLPAAPYSSDDPAAIARHVREARSAGIDALGLAWNGPNEPRTDGNLQKLLAAGAEQGLWATVVVETDKPEFFPTADSMVAALRYLREKYASRPNFLRREGRPAYMFWRASEVPRLPGQSALQTWRWIRDQVDPEGKDFWIMEGLSYDLLEVFDGLFGYAIHWSPNVGSTTQSWASQVETRAARFGQPKLFIPTVMPGYDDTHARPGASQFRARDNGAFLRDTWDAAMAVAPSWVNLTSFNEWIEGSQIEPSVSYGTFYLDLNRELSQPLKAQ